MESKSILVGVIIGIIVGGLVGFIAAPSPDISSYESEINQLVTQVASLQSNIEDLEDELEDTVPIVDYNQLEQQVSQLQSQLTSLETQLTVKADTIEELQQTISELEGLGPPTPPKEGDPGSSRFFPVDIGVTMHCWYTDWTEQKFYADITMLQIIRGSTAWSMIHDANIFNDPPTEGFEYILVKIKFEYTQGPDFNTAWDISTFDFDAVSEDGYVYDTPIVVAPEPPLDAELYPGASHEGWAAYQVRKTDTKPVLGWMRGTTGEMGVWFKLYTG